MEEVVEPATSLEESALAPLDITNGEQDEKCLLCSVCSKWLPRGNTVANKQDLKRTTDTIDLPESKSPLPGDWRYLFKCTTCNNGSTFFKFHQRSW